MARIRMLPPGEWSEELRELVQPEGKTDLELGNVRIYAHRPELATAYGPFADAPDGSDVFAHLYRSREWARRLRKDMSGAAWVDMDDKQERASVVTTRGTRWPFRKRDNGIWGLMVFTAELVAEAEKATRDLAVVEAAAADYDKLSGR